MYYDFKKILLLICLTFLIIQNGCTKDNNDFSHYDFVRNIEKANIHISTKNENFSAIEMETGIFESLDQQNVSENGQDDWQAIKTETTETLIQYSRRSQNTNSILSLDPLQINDGIISAEIKFDASPAENIKTKTERTLDTLLEYNSFNNLEDVVTSNIKAVHGNWFHIEDFLVENSLPEEKYFTEVKSLSKNAKYLLFELEPFFEGIMQTEINLGKEYSEGGVFISFSESGQEGYFITIDFNGFVILSDTKGEEGRRYITHSKIPEEVFKLIRKDSWINFTAVFYKDYLLVYIKGLSAKYVKIFTLFDALGHHLTRQNRPALFGLAKGNGHIVRFRNIKFKKKVDFPKTFENPLPEAGVVFRYSEGSGYGIALNMDGSLSIFTLNNGLADREITKKILGEKLDYDKWYSLKMLIWKNYVAVFLERKFKFIVSLESNDLNGKRLGLYANNLKNASFKNYSFTKNISFRSLSEMRKSIGMIEKENLYLDFNEGHKNTDFRLNPRFNKFVKKVKLNSDTRKALYLPYPGSFSYDINIPPNGILIFSYALAPQILDKEGYSHLFEVLIEGENGRAKKIFNKELNPMDALDKGWHNERIDLSEYAGAKVKIMFQNERTQKDGGVFLKNFAFWGNPVIFKPKKDNDINVILISIDTLRADHLSSYGYSKITSPFIDKLASHGTLFKNAISQAPWTRPSHMSIFTSLFASSHGIGLEYERKYKNHKERLPEIIETLPERLKDNGYFTASFNGGGHISSDYGFSQGFYTYNEQWPHINESYEPLSRWIRENHDMKFFLFFHAFDVHDYDENHEVGTFKDIISPKDHKLYIIDKYDSSIKYTDKFVRLLVNDLQELNLLDNTLIVFTSDHGEEFWDHKKFEHPFNGHSRYLYKSLINIPLIFYLPGKIPQNKIIDEKAMLIDIYPTILDILKITIPKHTQGISLLPLINGDVSSYQKKRPYAFSEEHFVRDRIAVMSNKYKFILRKEANKETLSSGNYRKWKVSNLAKEKQSLLFNVKLDPAEQNNIIAENRDIEKQMLEEIELLEQGGRINYMKFHNKNTGKLKIDKDTENRLRALGYIN